MSRNLLLILRKTVTLEDNTDMAPIKVSTALLNKVKY